MPDIMHMGQVHDSRSNRIRKEHTLQMHSNCVCWYLWWPWSRRLFFWGGDVWCKLKKNALWRSPKSANRRPEVFIKEQCLKSWCEGR